jgi:TPR repeat protein
VQLDVINAARYFKLTADQTLAEAHFQYGLCHANGQGVPIDFIKAAQSFKMAADQNHSGAQFQYALCLAEGHGFQMDLLKAAQQIRLAAQFDGQSAVSRDRPAVFGFACPITMGAAQALYEQALRREDAYWLNDLGKCLEIGQCAHKDIGLAAECYAASAKRGNAIGQANFGFCIVLSETCLNAWSYMKSQ